MIKIRPRVYVKQAPYLYGGDNVVEIDKVYYINVTIYFDMYINKYIDRNSNCI